jgi:hypothetical protein
MVPSPDGAKATHAGCVLAATSAGHVPHTYNYQINCLNYMPCSCRREQLHNQLHSMSVPTRHPHSPTCNYQSVPSLSESPLMPYTTGIK